LANLRRDFRRLCQRAGPSEDWTTKAGPSALSVPGNLDHVTSITVGLDEKLAARLAEQAARAGMTPEQWASKTLEDHLAETGATSREATRADDPFAWIGLGSSDELRGAAVDDLLAKGFGQSRS
jgi:hypothetical protein